MIDYEKIDALFGPPLNETASLPQPQKVNGAYLALLLGLGLLIVYVAKNYIDNKIAQSQDPQLRKQPQ